MNEKQEENMEILNAYMGYGNLKARYWFIGFEEGGQAWKCDKNKDFFKEHAQYFNILKDRYHKNNFYFLANEDFANISPTKNPYSPYLGGIRKFLNSLKPTSDTDINLDIIGSRNINAFLLNLYPLGRPNRNNPNYPNDYFCLFGFKNINDYISSAFYKKRIELFKGLFKEYFISSTESKVLFCFGKGDEDWKEFREVLAQIFINKFEINSSDAIKNKHYVFEINNKKIFLLYHPRSGRLPYYLVEEISKTIINDRQ
jgi:hypothetical protein